MHIRWHTYTHTDGHQSQRIDRLMRVLWRLKVQFKRNREKQLELASSGVFIQFSRLYVVDWCSDVVDCCACVERFSFSAAENATPSHSATSAEARHVCALSFFLNSDESLWLCERIRPPDIASHISVVGRPSETAPRHIKFAELFQSQHCCYWSHSILSSSSSTAGDLFSAFVAMSREGFPLNERKTNNKLECFCKGFRF